MVEGAGGGGDGEVPVGQLGAGVGGREAWGGAQEGVEGQGEDQRREGKLGTVSAVLLTASPQHFECELL